MPQDGRPGRVHVVEYFKMDDSRKAARLLLEEAALAGFDVDQTVTTKPRDTIRLGSGEFAPDPADRRLIEQAAALTAAGDAEHAFICLIQFNRSLSFREIATLMESGVHLYRGVPYYTYIARVNAATLPALQQMETVVWIGELTPERKYPQDRQFDATRPIHVYSLVGDTAECRADLESLGATILITSRTSRGGHEWERYVVAIDPVPVADLAALWWVHYVHQPAAAVPKVSSASEGSYREIIPSAPAVGELKPLDSRRLVSAVAGGQFEGAGQTVLIYEFGLDWEHPDLHANLIEDIRFPATNDALGLHGAMVAGIAVGRRNTNVLNGGVSGIAPRAKFRFVSTDYDYARELIPVAWIQNFSISEIGNNGVYTDDSFNLDEFVRDGAVIVVAAGNDGAAPFNHRNEEFSIGPWASAKNVIAVGAVNCVPAEIDGDTVGQVTRYSSAGPTNDDILKPDVVAPGGFDHVNSACGQGIVSCGATAGTPCATFDFGQNYVVDDGTSLAAPHVTGVATLIVEAYKRWQSTNYPDKSNYFITTRLARALLINSAIPLRFGGANEDDTGYYGGSESENARLLSGYANTHYGYGLANGYSGVNSSESEYRRVFVWQNVAYDVGIQESGFTLDLRDDYYNPLTPRFLVATLCYNDVPLAGIVNQLLFSLRNEQGATYTYTLPSANVLGTTRDLVPGTAQKIIVPWPDRGQWYATVNYVSTTAQDPSQRPTDFAVVVEAMIQAPALQVIGLKAETEAYILRAGSTLDLPVTVENIGGNVAAGVTVRIESPLFTQPTTDQDRAFYLGNLVKRGATASKTFKLQGGMPGTNYDLHVVVDAANRLLEGGPYPIRRKVRVRVEDFRFVRGEVVALPGVTAGIRNVDIFVDGSLSGVKSDSTGKYSVKVVKGFSGEIRPKKGTTKFYPDSTSYENTPVLNDRASDNYEAEVRRITGRIYDETGQGVGGVIIAPRRTPGTDLRGLSTDTTLTNGSFEVFVEHGWSGRLEPQQDNRYVSFSLIDPVRASYDSVTVDVQNHDYSTRLAAPWTTNGKLVTSTVADDASPRLVADGFGGAIVVWEDERSTLSGLDIWAQRIGPSGVAWGVDQVPVCQATGSQETPRIVRLTDGTFLVVWVDRRNAQRDVYAQRLDLNGQMLWAPDGIPVCTAPGDQRNIEVIAASAVSAVIAWEDLRSGASQVYAQRIGSDGSMSWSLNGLIIGLDEGFRPRLAANTGGSVFLAWQSSDGVVASTRCSRLDEFGFLDWGTSGGVVLREGPVSAAWTDRGPAIAAYEDGSCVVATQAGEVRLHKLGSAGVPVWPTDGVAIGLGDRPEVVTAPDGGATVAYRFPYILHRVLVKAQRVGAEGEYLWGADPAGIEVSPGVNGDTPIVISSGTRSIVTFRSYAGLLDSPSFASDVAVQLLDDTGSRLWGSGLLLCNAAGNQNRPVATTDLVSGVVVCWLDKRAAPEERVYVGRVNDTTRSFLISGRIEDTSGAPVSKALVQAVSEGGPLVSRMSQPDGTFVLGVPEFWSGDVLIQLRGYFNQVSPNRQYVAPVTHDLLGVNFRLSHMATRWSSGGLDLATLDPEVSASPAVASAGADGCFVAWQDRDAMNRPFVVGQHLDSAGDIRWTVGGDLVAGNQFDDQAPIVVRGGGSAAFYLWKRNVYPENQPDGFSSGIWGQFLDRDMNLGWGDDGRLLIAGDQIGHYRACAGGNGGFFICWDNVTEQRLYVQHFLADGSASWATPATVGIGVLEIAPSLIADGVGGLLLGWQLGSYLYVQRVDGVGSVLWNGGNHPVTARALAFVTPGDFRFAGSGPSAYMVWSERSEVDSSDERIRMNWIFDGIPRLGPAGQPLNTEPGVQFVDDVAYDQNGGLRIAYTVIYGPTSKLVAQYAIPDISGTVNLRWGDDGRTISTGVIAPRNARVLGDENGEMLVFWRQDGNLHAQRMDWQGNFLWLDRQYRVFDGLIGSDDELTIASDGSQGAYIAWRREGESLKTTRHSDSLLVNAEISVVTAARKANQTVVPMEGNYVVGCPGADEDQIVVRLDLEGDMMNFLSAEAIQVVPRASAPVLFEATPADSAPRWCGDRFRTTVTISEIGGCGDDSATVEIYGWPVGTARFSVRSPDMETDTTPGMVKLPDFTAFGAHYCTSLPCSKSYSECADYVGDDEAVTASDFGAFGAHYNHQASWVPPGGSSPSQEGTGSVVLTFGPAQGVDGGQTVPVHVALDGVSPYSVAFIALRNANPSLRFNGWTQSTAFPYGTICTETIRDGERQVILAVLGGKNATIPASGIGVVELLAASEGGIDITEEDLALVTADLLDVSGQVYSVAPRRVTTEPRYHFGLEQNYPNPFNPSTTIRYSIGSRAMVDLRIYDVTGAQIRTLIRGERAPGSYRIVWNGDNNRGNQVASGVYLYRLAAGSFKSTRKMVLLR